MTEAVMRVLPRSQALGFLGPGPLDVQARHALGFAAGVPSSGPTRFLDLGSGGGLPGLVLAAVAWPQAEGVLLESGERRCAFLREAIDELSLGPRVRVVRARAEEAGRDEQLRAGFDLVVARSFGPPAVTAECAAPFLTVGGVLVVSEPPAEPPTVPATPVERGAGVTAMPGAGESDAAEAEAGEVDGGAGRPDFRSRRWPDQGVGKVGLEPVEARREPFAYQVLRQAHLCPDRYPRRVGIPAKRPLF